MPISIAENAGYINGHCSQAQSRYTSTSIRLKNCTQASVQNTKWNYTTTRTRLRSCMDTPLPRQVELHEHSHQA